MAFIHLGFGFLLNLSVDEAHYALYGIYLDWSYFDHPPMVGWIQAIPAQLGAPDGVLRLIPESLWLLTVILSAKLSSVIIDQFNLDNDDNANTQALKTYAWWFTTIIILTAPIFHVLAVGLLPDTLLMVLVPWMMLLTLKINQSINTHHSNELLLWTLLGVVLGLSGLSKYTSIFPALAIPICLFFWQGLKLLRRPGLWLSLLIAGILISPIIYWNSQHEWISFVYQIKHGAGNQWQVRRLPVFILNQLLTYGALPALGLWLIFKNKFIFNKALLAFFAIPFVIFLMMSGGGGSLPHWTSPAWIALAPISGIGLAISWINGSKKLIKILIALQLLICTLGFVLLYFGGIPGMSKDDPLGKNNPIADLYGWKDAGTKAVSIAKANNITSIAVSNWTLASRIAWYAKPLPVFVIDDRFDQFDIWFGKPKLANKSIVINWSQMPYPEPTESGAYKNCKMIDKLEIYRLGRIISSFDYLLCEDWGYQTHSTTNGN
jgi:4-amino-4-deoxy-L-arabinose transferase-like glycosyltransferase